jgi:hypothetical protein
MNRPCISCLSVNSIEPVEARQRLPMVSIMAVRRDPVCQLEISIERRKWINSLIQRFKADNTRTRARYFAPVCEPRKKTNRKIRLQALRTAVQAGIDSGVAEGDVIVGRSRSYSTTRRSYKKSPCMNEYRPSVLAELDLADTADYTVDIWGEKHAHLNLDDLVRRISARVRGGNTGMRLSTTPFGCQPLRTFSCTLFILLSNHRTIP